MAVTAVIVARGIADGIERARVYLMPALIVLVVVLAIYSMSQGDARAALRFLFEVDPARLSARTALEALGLGFFSIGVGLCGDGHLRGIRAPGASVSARSRSSPS